MLDHNSWYPEDDPRHGDPSFDLPPFQPLTAAQRAASRETAEETITDRAHLLVLPAGTEDELMKDPEFRRRRGAALAQDWELRRLVTRTA